MSDETAKLIEMVPTDYYRDLVGDCPSLSVSIAKKLIIDCPLRAWKAHPKLGNKPDDPTDAMDFGTVVHSKLSGVATSICVIEADDFRTKAAQQKRDEARANFQVPILARKIPHAEYAADAIRRCCGLSDPIFPLNGKWEQVIVWESHGVLCRAMLDHLGDGYIFDLKVTSNANPSDGHLAGHIHDMGYDIQSAAYIEAVESVRPELVGRVGFYFGFVEPTEDHLCSLVKLDEAMLELGRMRWRRAKRIWNECLSTNHWPGYPPGVHLISPRPWDMQQEEMESGNLH